VLRVLGEAGRGFDPMLHNTVNATVVRAGESTNVIPGEATVDLDGRLLPGFTDRDLLAEVGAVAGPGVELEVTRYEPVPASVDLALFDLLAGVLREREPAATAIPMLMPGISDGRIFARLGIQTYGFLPTPLPRDLKAMQLIHAADERIPVDALEFGTAAILNVLERYRG
jgi:acetylornithine deacetylase/succinyl-diaminopimelate desuccinylase-like protein